MFLVLLLQRGETSVEVGTSDSIIKSVVGYVKRVGTEEASFFYDSSSVGLFEWLRQ